MASCFFSCLELGGGVLCVLRESVGDRIGEKGSRLEEELIILNTAPHFQLTVLCLCPWL